MSGDGGETIGVIYADGKVLVAGQHAAQNASAANGEARFPAPRGDAMPWSFKNVARSEIPVSPRLALS
ncbi:hypothetical protein [Luteimonas sp. 3794]|uniref:hypothetical protein n=1 Tax=Luteimonas sp. 3794 TaxID=2817730 RepID=UPI00285FE943|nr:hypothetical protein [Luteimonas sp. 3794]MDR6991727.1 hypothetical protein [Luteimonas sp. 3794]